MANSSKVFDDVISKLKNEDCSKNPIFIEELKNMFPELNNPVYTNEVLCNTLLDMLESKLEAKYSEHYKVKYGKFTFVIAKSPLPPIKYDSDDIRFTCSIADDFKINGLGQGIIGDMYSPSTWERFTSYSAYDSVFEKVKFTDIDGYERNIRILSPCLIRVKDVHNNTAFSLYAHVKEGKRCKVVDVSSDTKEVYNLYFMNISFYLSTMLNAFCDLGYEDALGTVLAKEFKAKEKGKGSSAFLENIYRHNGVLDERPEGSYCKLITKHKGVSYYSDFYNTIQSMYYANSMLKYIAERIVYENLVSNGKTPTKKDIINDVRKLFQGIELFSGYSPSTYGDYEFAVANNRIVNLIKN